MRGETSNEETVSKSISSFLGSEIWNAVIQRCRDYGEWLVELADEPVPAFTSRIEGIATFEWAEAHVDETYRADLTAVGRFSNALAREDAASWEEFEDW